MGVYTLDEDRVSRKGYVSYVHIQGPGEMRRSLQTLVP
jgi:hypothetical protein